MTQVTPVTQVTLGVRRGLQGPLEVQVDGSVTALQAEVRARQGRVIAATLTSPAGKEKHTATTTTTKQKDTLQTFTPACDETHSGLCT